MPPLPNDPVHCVALPMQNQYRYTMVATPYEQMKLMYIKNSKKNFWLLMPTQLFTHGQWWSILMMHRLQMLQWWARGGLKLLHRAHWRL